jgi:flotillin
MTMEELFNNRRLFRDRVIEYVQKELDQFGLRIYNANVKELEDLGDSRYFESLSMRAREGAQSQAQVDVANARMIGSVGQAEKEGKTKQEIAKIHAHTAVLETERKVEKADADRKLKSREIEIAKDLQLEQISANRTAEQRDAELQKTVEERRAEMELERLRATTVVQAKIGRESAQEKADADLYSQQKKSDAQAYNQKKEAEAVAYRVEQDANAAKYRQTQKAEGDLISKEKEGQALFLLADKEAQANAVKIERKANAEFVAREREAEAGYITRKKEADGLKEMASAYAELSTVLGGPQGLLQYLMLQNGTFTDLANANARAINGLQPKINIWNTGAQDGAADSMAPIRNLIQTLPPMLSTIQEQTGMTAPSWLMNQPGQQQQQSNGSNGSNGKMTAEERAADKQRWLQGMKQAT